jgi:hypothetical protein
MEKKKNNKTCMQRIENVHQVDESGARYHLYLYPYFEDITSGTYTISRERKGLQNFHNPRLFAWSNTKIK